MEFTHINAHTTVFVGPSLHLLCSSGCQTRACRLESFNLPEKMLLLSLMLSDLVNMFDLFAC